MDTTAQERFLRIHTLAAQDDIYQKLHKQCAELDLPFLAVMEKLSEDEQQIVTEYIRAVGASALRMLEIACST